LKLQEYRLKGIGNPAEVQISAVVRICHVSQLRNLLFV
jgi:hypothetical protein